MKPDDGFEKKSQYEWPAEPICDVFDKYKLWGGQIRKHLKHSGLLLSHTIKKTSWYVILYKQALETQR